MSTKTLLVGFALFACCTTHVSASSNGTATTTSRSFDPRADPMKCPAGTYSQSGGGAPCFDCMAGSYNKNLGAPTCTQADKGYYVPSAAATAQSTCTAGSYSGMTGSTACSDCTPGNYCPNKAMATPSACAAGTFSAGGRVTSCSKCAPGKFTGQTGSSSCCSCCANFYAAGEGNKDCDSCPSYRPYSNPGTTSSGSCVSSPQLYAKQNECKQSSSGTCPNSPPVISPYSRRSMISKPKCKPRQKACPLYGAYSRGSLSALAGYDCVDVHNDLESCGGCVDESRDGKRSKDGGRDCSAIPHVDSVRCHASRCIIDSCRRGFVKSADGEHCVSLHASLQNQAGHFKL